MSGSKRPVDDHRGGLEATAEVDRADDGLDRVGEDRGLVPPPSGRLLATAQLDVVTEADPGPTPASARALTTAARSLASRPSEVGWGEVEVSVTTTPSTESRGTPAVRWSADHRSRTRRDRWVRGAVEQLGGPGRVPERRAELGVVGASGPGQPQAGQRTWRRSARRRTGRGAARTVREVLGTARGVHCRSPGSVRQPSRPSGGDGCCCATSSASGQPL